MIGPGAYSSRGTGSHSIDGTSRAPGEALAWRTRHSLHWFLLSHTPPERGTPPASPVCAGRSQHGPVGTGPVSSHPAEHPEGRLRGGTARPLGDRASHGKAERAGASGRSVLVSSFVGVLSVSASRRPSPCFCPSNCPPSLRRDQRSPYRGSAQARPARTVGRGRAVPWARRGGSTTRSRA